MRTASSTRSVDDHLDGQGPAHRFLGGGGDGLVEGVGMQAVAVVVDGAEGLQGGADVVELDVLAVQGAARGLDVVLEHLGAGRSTVFFPQGHGPDAPCHPPDHGILGVHAVGEEERQVGAELVQIHAAGQVVFQVGEPVGQGEGQLRDGVRPGLGDMVARNGDRVEIAHVVLDEIGLDVAHHFEGEVDGEDAGVLPLVLLEDVGLDGAAHVGEDFGADLPIGLG
jgi:hypothetical protein